MPMMPHMQATFLWEGMGGKRHKERQVEEVAMGLFAMVKRTYMHYICAHLHYSTQENVGAVVGWL